MLSEGKGLFLNALHTKKLPLHTTTLEKLNKSKDYVQIKFALKLF